MIEPENLPRPDELTASLRRVVDGQKAETVYDAHGSPIAILMPIAETATDDARQRVLTMLRELRDGDPEEQRRTWEQLEEVLAEERNLEPAP